MPVRGGVWRIDLGSTQQKCPCSSGSSLGLDWGCHCARQLAPVHAHLLRDLIALHMECLLLTLSGMVKPSTIPSHAHVRLLQPGRGKKKYVSRPHAAPRGRKGEGARRPRAPISGAARWAAGAVYFYPSLSRSSRPPHPCCRRAPSPRPTLTCPGLSAISPFAFTARQPSPYPSSGHRPQLATLFFSPPPASSRVQSTSRSRLLPKERHPEPNDSGSSRVRDGPGQSWDEDEKGG